jgi:hypothetical protein
MRVRITATFDSVPAAIALLLAWKLASGRPQRPKPINWKVPKQCKSSKSAPIANER